MKYPLDLALRGTAPILAEIRPKELGTPSSCVPWDPRALVNLFGGAARWWAAASFGPASEASGGAGAAGELAAFLGRAV